MIALHHLLMLLGMQLCKGVKSIDDRLGEGPLFRLLCTARRHSRAEQGDRGHTFARKPLYGLL